MAGTGDVDRAWSSYLSVRLHSRWSFLSRRNLHTAGHTCPTERDVSFCDGPTQAGANGGPFGILDSGCDPSDARKRGAFLLAERDLVLTSEFDPKQTFDA